MIEALKSLFPLIDKPWKAIVFLVTIPLLVIAWLVYVEADLIDSYLNRIVGEAEVNEEAFDTASGMLLTVADVVLLFEVDIALNSQIVIRAKTHEGEAADAVGIEALFLQENDDISLVIDALQNQTICVDYNRLEELSQVGSWMTENGFNYACGHKLPSGTNVVAGFVTVGWLTEPTERERRLAEVALTRAAEQLTK